MPRYAVDPAVELQKHEVRIQQLEAQIAEYNRIEAESSKHSASTSSSPARVVRDADELQRIVDRLSRQIERPTENSGPLCQSKVGPLSSEDVESLVDRLAVSDVVNRTSKYEGLLQQAEDNLPLKKIAAAKGEEALLRLDVDQQQALGERLCNQALESKQRKTAEIRDAISAEAKSGVRAASPLSKKGMKECGQRLCDGSLAKRDAELAKLYDKYMSPLVPQKKLSLAEQAACAERLSKK